MAVFADKILDYFNSGAGSYTEPYGFLDPDGDGDSGIDIFGQEAINAVLGDDPSPGVNALSLPTGSYVTVGFTQGYITDGLGNDIFIRESGEAGDEADIYVSSLYNPRDNSDFVYLGRASSNSITPFDLASIDFTGLPVRAVKIFGLDNKGTSPGFDVANVHQTKTPTSLHFNLVGILGNNR